MKIKANNNYLKYQIKGKGENPVLIHGAGSHPNMRHHPVPAFSNSYRGIAYDVRGLISNPRTQPNLRST
jgi:hypothetical protein